MTRSRRAFASSSLSSPLRLRSFTSYPEPQRAPSLSTPYLLRLYSGLPVGLTILKLNTADDSRALPWLASARKRREEGYPYYKDYDLTSLLFFSSSLFILSFNVSFISLYVRNTEYCWLSELSRRERIENERTGAYQRCSQEYKETIRFRVLFKRHNSILF